MIDVREWQDRMEIKDDHTTASALTAQGAVPLYLSRVGGAGMGVAVGLIYCSDEIIGSIQGGHMRAAEGGGGTIGKLPTA